MTRRHTIVLPAPSAPVLLGWALAASMALAVGAGCNNATEATKTEASTTAESKASPSVAGKASTAKQAAPRGRKKLDTTSRREHQKQLRQQP